FEVLLGDCLDDAGVVSAPAAERAAELTAMLTDPAVRAVVPPWGGQLAIDLLPHLDWESIAAAEPTWLVGFSDTTTLLLPLTVRAGWATLHGQNLMDTPYQVPAPLMSWLDVVTAPRGAVLSQAPSRAHRRGAFDDWAADPTVTGYSFDTAGTWVRLDGEEPVTVSGRLLGGCLETIHHLQGTTYGDVPGFAEREAPEGLVVYVEAAEAPALDTARSLHGMRLAGWFDHARAVLVARTSAPDSPGLTQREAVLDALGGLGVPIIGEVDCGHVPPHLALVNGAPTTVRWSPRGSSLVQTLA
uniref:S66 family peptidase n=1 Tax=Actinotalea sp. C106 TaxID=2908644 RepID=UPI002028BB2C